jgi:acyl-CoA thioesterase-1
MESRLVAAALGLLLIACGGGTDSGRDSTVAQGVSRADSATVRPSARASAIFLGTSLTAGLGVDLVQAYPAILQRKADSIGLGVEILNRGNSGETSAGALTRLDWLLQSGPELVVIETGANDGLRGQDPDSIAANIQAIIDRIRASDSTIRIALIQMEALPNLGRRYVTRFHAIYPELATRNNIVLLPFLLEGVAGVDSLNQADGVHPTPRGQVLVAENLWPALRPLLAEISSSSPRR